MAYFYIEASAGVSITGAGTSGDPWTGIDDETLFDHAETNGFGSGDTLHCSNVQKFVFNNPWVLSATYSAVNPAVVKAWDNGGAITAETPGGTVDAFEIDGAGAVTTLLTHSNKQGLVFIGAKAHSTTTEVWKAYVSWQHFDCEFYDAGANEVVESSTSTAFHNCLVRDSGGSGVDGFRLGSTGLIDNCEVRNVTGNGITLTAVNSTVTNSLVHDCDEHGIAAVAADRCQISSNTIDGNGTASMNGIDANTTTERAVIKNNLITNYNGTSASAIKLTAGVVSCLGPNGFYNNTANITDTGVTIIDNSADDVVEASDPYTNRASDDYSLSGADSIGAGVPARLNLNLGAYQEAAGGGGGGGGGIKLTGTGGGLIG